MNESVRLLQYEPAWSISLYLKIFNVNHIIENISSPICLGKLAPVSVIGNQILSGDDSLSRMHLQSNNNILDHEIILIDYIESHFKYVFNTLADKNDFKYKFSPFIPNFYLNSCNHLYKLAIKLNLMLLNNRSIENPIISLESAYSVLSNLINDSFNFIDESLSQVVECILFGIIMNSLSNSITLDLINKKYQKLKGFAEQRLIRYYYNTNSHYSNKPFITNHFIRKNPLYSDILMNLELTEDNLTKLNYSSIPTYIVNYPTTWISLNKIKISFSIQSIKYISNYIFKKDSNEDIDDKNVLNISIEGILFSGITVSMIILHLIESK